MTVTARQSDTDGLLLQANITALTAQIAITSGTLHKYQMQLQLDRLQRELVYHYLDTGRLNAANVLSTMT